MTVSLGLPSAIETTVDQFIEAAKTTFGTALQSVVLFGSGAEQQLRATSDVNLLLVLSAYDPAVIDSLREPLRIARAAVDLKAMFVLQGEVAEALDAFAVKFSDILNRHRIVYGIDPFIGLTPSREAMLRRVRQVLLNYQIRLREQFILANRRDEQLTRLVADAAGPLRASAAAILTLEDQPAATPKRALAALVAQFHEPDFVIVLEAMSLARGGELLAPASARPAVIKLMRLVTAMRERAENLAAKA